MSLFLLPFAIVGYPAFTSPRTTTAATNGTAQNVTPAHCLTSPILSVIFDDIPLDRSISEDSNVTTISERRDAPDSSLVTDTTL